MIQIAMFILGWTLGIAGQVWNIGGFLIYMFTGKVPLVEGKRKGQVAWPIFHLLEPEPDDKEAQQQDAEVQAISVTAGQTGGKHDV